MRRMIAGARSSRLFITGAVAGLALLPSGTALAGGGGGGGGGHGPKPPRVTVVADGLYNPRGVAVGWDGSVYVAESGAGGSTLAEGEVEGTSSLVCLGNTGGVTRVRWGHAQRVIDLPSMAGAVDGACDSPDVGASAVGPSDIALQLDGSLSISMGLGGNVDTRGQLPAPFADSFGHLLELDRRGRLTTVADITAYEHAANPDGGEDDSNPYGIASFLGYNFVADAGGNDVVTVDRRGNVSTLAVLPDVGPVPTPPLSCTVPPDVPQPPPPPGTPIPAQQVPTSVAIGPGGIYVAQLTGFPFAQGVAKVYRLNPFTHTATPVATGFTSIVGLAFGPDGSMYVLEIARDGVLDAEVCGNAAGRLVKVKNGVQTEIEVPGGLTAPGGVAVGLDGTIYVSNNSTAPGGAGQLLAIRQR